MAIDTKPNFSSNKFEQCAEDIMNLSGCTQIYGTFDMESGSTFTICDNAGADKVFTSDAGGVGTWQTLVVPPAGVTAVSGGSGMNFSPITTTGTVVLGTPSSVTSGSTNSVGATTHNHAYDGQTFVSGTQGILVDGNNRFYLDDTYITDATLPNLYSYSGITANQSIGALPSGQTLGMVYITNTGSSTAYLNLGTTPTGDDITPYQTIQVDAGEDVSVTVNMRLSLTANTTIYVSSTDWTNVGINLQWANITYQNASTTINPGDLPVATPTTLGAISVGTGLSVDGFGHLCATGGTGGGTITGGTNGLGENGANICLGGALTTDTAISADTNTFQVIGESVDSYIKLQTCGGVIPVTQMQSKNNNYSANITTTAYSVANIALIGMQASGNTSSQTQINAYYDCALMFVQEGASCNSLNIQSGSTVFRDDINSKGIEYAACYHDNYTARSIVDAQYVTGLTSGGSGGFLGLVTKATAEPADLQDNQWVKPEPMSTDCFAYTFDNFTDSGSTAISVNLSLCDSYLRYCCTGATGGYWIDEGYEKPLSSGYTWVGGDTCKATEVAVINEWVNTPAEVCYVGQKYAYQTQTIFQVDVGTCATIPNKILVSGLTLSSVGNTCVFTIPAGMCGMINSAKLIMSNDATPDSITISIGNNSSTYNNMLSACTIDDVLTCEVYELMPTSLPSCAASQASGSDVYFRVNTAATGGTLNANLLVEGYVY